MKINTERSESYFYFIMSKFIEMEGIDYENCSSEDSVWLMYFANFFFTHGMIFTIEENRIENETSAKVMH